jgi:hypothetical protein
MEKFRAFLEVLKKYHFWVLCGLIVLLSFVSWFLATSEEAQQFLTRKREIDSKFELDRRISNTREHPSRKYIQGISDLESGTLTSQVANASTRLYREMRDNNPLPKIFPDEGYQENFKAAFEKIWAPMEDIEKLPPSKQLDDFYRTRYRNHIEGHFPKLFELIERRTVDEQTKKTSGIVDWVDADQKIKTFLERYTGGSTPSTLDIMMAQEDLWVYETLLKVIRNTNDVGPDPKHDPKHYLKPANHKVARIKQILAMDIGKDAVQSWTSCEKALINLPSEGGAATTTGRGGTPLAGRYVDDKGKPLLDPTQQPYGEFRMMPINLKVVIEQEEIPRLLAECANSAMRIDVRAVRILVQQPPPLDASATEASTGGSHPGGGAGPSAPMGMAMPMGGMGGHGDAGKDESVYNEESANPVYQPVPVEVQGIIYIYNPPRVQNPGETAGDSGSQAAPAAPPTPASPARAAIGAPTSPAAVTPLRGGRP